MRVDGSGDFVLHVRHRAAPQGSKDIQRGKNGKPFLIESSAGVKPFRTEIKRAATGQDGLPLARFEGPVLVGIEFEFRQAKSNTDLYPTGQNIGDLDKLTRAVLDGLVMAKVIEDDRHVVGFLPITKAWGPDNRAVITVRSAAEPGVTQSVVDFSPASAQAFGELMTDANEAAHDGPPWSQNPFD